nr:hypothetical protein [Streptomyces antimicrobicus]
MPPAASGPTPPSALPSALPATPPAPPTPYDAVHPDRGHGPHHGPEHDHHHGPDPDHALADAREPLPVRPGPETGTADPDPAAPPFPDPASAAGPPLPAAARSGFAVAALVLAGPGNADRPGDGADGAAGHEGPLAEATPAQEPAYVMPQPRPLHQGGLNPLGALTFDTVDYADVVTPERAFDALHAYAAPALLRQTYLLTGRRRLAQQSVERAFRMAWDRWPEVATDPDPVGWVRAAAYEWALSPWHPFRRPRRHPDRTPADPADRILLDALLALPPRHRRAVLLYDGVGLDLPDTAAELEASTPATGARLVHAHAALAARVPGLAAVPAARQWEVLHNHLGALVPAVRLAPRPAGSVRHTGERRAGLWARAAVGLTAVIAAATAYTVSTAPTGYVPSLSPARSVSGVPPHAGPQPLTDEGKEIQQKLRSGPHPAPARLLPRTE